MAGRRQLPLYNRLLQHCSSSDQHTIVFWLTTFYRINVGGYVVVIVNVICSPNTEARGRTQVGLVAPTAESPCLVVG